MNTRSIAPRNLQALLILMVMCGSLLGGAFTVRQDSWIAIVFIGVLYLPFILLYGRICFLFPGENLFDIMQDLFGKAAGIAAVLAMTFYAIVVTALQLRNFAELTVVISLNDTPKVPIMILLLLPVMYIVKGGIKLIGRWAIITCGIILINIAVTLVFSSNIMDWTNLLPVMDHSFSAIASDAFSLGAIAMGETVMIMGLMSEVKKTKKPCGVFLPGILIGVCLFALVIIRNILVLGADLEQQAKFSTYMAVRIIHVSGFFERVESIISFSLLLLGFTKMAVFLWAASLGTARLFKSGSPTRFILPVSLLVLVLASVIFSSVFEMYKIARAYWIFALPFQLLIPLIIWITAEIRVRKTQKAP